MRFSGRKLGIGVLFVTLALGSGLVARRAIAHGEGCEARGHGGFRHAMIKRMVERRIDQALDEARVSDSQRAAIHAVRDRVLAQVEQRASGHPAHLERALRLFESDKIDDKELSGLRAQRETEHQQMAELVVQAFTEVHGILTPKQRKIIADHVRAHAPGER